MEKSYSLLALAMVCIVFGVFLSCGDDDDDGGNSDEEANEVVCTITGVNMTEIPVQIVSDNCEPLGLTSLLARVFANPTMTIFEARGQYVITNENTYYCRGNGPTDDRVCFDELHHAGDFSVFTEYPECINTFTLDIVTYPNEEANAFCQISIQHDQTCPQNGDDDDDNDDDDDVVDDDDNSTSESEEKICEYIVNVCAPGYYGSVEACYDEETGYLASCVGDQEAFLNCALACIMQDCDCTETIFQACENACFYDLCLE